MTTLPEVYGAGPDHLSTLNLDSVSPWADVGYGLRLRIGIDARAHNRIVTLFGRLDGLAFAALLSVVVAAASDYVNVSPWLMALALVVATGLELVVATRAGEGTVMVHAELQEVDGGTDGR